MRLHEIGGDKVKALDHVFKSKVMWINQVQWHVVKNNVQLTALLQHSRVKRKTYCRVTSKKSDLF